MGMTIDGLEKECQYCYREIDNSGLEGFRCTNRTAIKARASSWCYPQNANEPCSMCEYCKPKQNMGMSIDESLEWLISRKEHYEMDDNCQELAQALELAIETMRKYQQLEDFAKWVATEVIDEEMWTYNHLSFAELACRKLVKLGIMQESDGEYTYKVVEDGNDKYD